MASPSLPTPSVPAVKTMTYIAILPHDLHSLLISVLPIPFLPDAEPDAGRSEPGTI